MYFLPSHLQPLLFVFFSVLWESEDICLYAHAAALSVEQNPAPHSPMRRKVGQAWRLSLAKTILHCNGYSCCSMLPF